MNGEEFYRRFNFLEMFGGEVPDDPDFCGECYRCLNQVEGAWGIPVTAHFMVVCKICGNKRCPKSTDHDLDCTNSNEPGQPGSRYPKLSFRDSGLTPQERAAMFFEDLEDEEDER